MTVTTYTRPAKCKDCTFAQQYRPMKKDGTLSWRKRAKCLNPESGKTDIRMNDLVCNKWKLF